jgi:hypothetical protein
MYSTYTTNSINTGIALRIIPPAMSRGPPTRRTVMRAQPVNRAWCSRLPGRGRPILLQALPARILIAPHDRHYGKRAVRPSRAG